MNNYIKEQIEEIIIRTLDFVYGDNISLNAEKMRKYLTQCWKKAQEEDRKGIIELIEKMKKDYRGKLTDNEISRFSPQADVYCEALDDLISHLNIK